MLQYALRKTLGQLGDPDFRRVLLMSLILSAAALLLVFGALYWLWPVGWVTGIDIIDSAGFAVIIALLSYFLFPGLATVAIGFQVERIVDAVERKHYPAARGQRSVPVGEAVLSGLSLTAAALLINLAALVPYLLLLVFTGGLATLALALLLNGYLLGREYLEAAAGRHAPRRAVRDFRRRFRADWLPAGLLVAGLFMIPFVNIVAPIIGVALMTHVFHSLRARADVA